METYIDDLAVDGWATDIKGEPIKIPGIHPKSEDVVFAGSEMKSGDVVVDTYTPAGKAKYSELIKRGHTDREAWQEMVEGVHYSRKIVPFSKFRQEYGDPFNTDKNIRGYNNHGQSKYKGKKSVQSNPHYIFSKN